MSPEKQRIAIATACGLTNAKPVVVKNVKYQGDDRTVGISSDSGWIPDYLNDLNACHEMEKTLRPITAARYHQMIQTRLKSCDLAIGATSSLRAEAFLRVMGLWEEEANTTKSASSTCPTNEQADRETAEQKVAWLTEILVTKAGDPVFSDYWLRLARRNLRLGLPLTTPEPELNPSTEESSAVDHFRDATKMVSGESSAPTPTQPKP